MIHEAQIANLRAEAGRRIEALVADLERQGFRVTVTWYPHDDLEIEPDVSIHISTPLVIR